MKLLKAHFNKTLAGIPSQSPGMSMRDFSWLQCSAWLALEKQSFFAIILKQFWDSHLPFDKTSRPWPVTKLTGECMTTHRLQEKTKAAWQANNEQSKAHVTIH